MKIIINEYESYELNLPETMTSSELFSFKARLDHIVKLIGRDPLLEVAKGSPMNYPKISRKHSPITQRPWDQSREEGIKFVKAHYCGTEEEKKAYEIIAQRPWNDIIKRVASVKIKWNLTPEEVGLVRWPVQGERSDDRIYIQDGTETETSVPETEEQEAIAD